jgi:hypothetical protein
VTVFIGILGIFGTFCRSRCLLISYTIILCLLIVAQCIAGGLSLTTSSDQSKVSSYSTRAWSAMTDDMRNQFQSTYSCCGYNVPLDRPGSNCATVIPCSNQMQNQVANAFKSTGIYLFVSAAIQLFGVVVAIVLTVDEGKRTSGYGHSW